MSRPPRSNFPFGGLRGAREGRRGQGGFRLLRRRFLGYQLFLEVLLLQWPDVEILPANQDGDRKRSCQNCIFFHSVRLRRPSGDRVFSAWVIRVASSDPADGQPHRTNRGVAAECLHSVPRAGWIEPAATRKDRGDEELVRADKNRCRKRNNTAGQHRKPFSGPMIEVRPKTFFRFH